MSNSMFEQYGYKSARDLMTDLARDIRDGGEIIFVRKPSGTCKIEWCYTFDGGYWLITYRRGRVVSLDYLDDIEGRF
ncbi:MAG: hypothetical protein VZR95_03995 [Alphaproteobacteria bacterium]